MSDPSSSGSVDPAIAWVLVCGVKTQVLRRQEIDGGVNLILGFFFFNLDLSPISMTAKCLTNPVNGRPDLIGTPTMFQGVPGYCKNCLYFTCNEKWEVLKVCAFVFHKDLILVINLKLVGLHK